MEQERAKQQAQDPALMPLPDTRTDGPLDWAHLVDAAKAFEGRLNVGKFQYDVANHRAAYEGGLSCRLLVTHLDFYIYGLEVFLSINVSHVEVPVVTLNLLARRRKIYSMGLNGNKCDSPRYVQK